jgi:hypothetical protein
VLERLPVDHFFANRKSDHSDAAYLRNLCFTRQRDSSWSTVNATFDPQTICNRAFFRFRVP